MNEILQIDSVVTDISNGQSVFTRMMVVMVVVVTAVVLVVMVVVMAMQ